MAVVEFTAAFIDGCSGEYWHSRLLGVRVRKFCLWHRLLLKTSNSPFLTEGRVTVFDLRVAIGICGLRYGETMFRKPSLGAFLIYLKAFYLSLKSPGPDQESPMHRATNPHVERFLEYISSYLQQPDYSVAPPPMSAGSQPSTRRGMAPDELEHACDLMSMGFTEREAWEMPLGKANWYRAIARRSQGVDVDFLTEGEKAFQESLPPEYRFE